MLTNIHSYLTIKNDTSSTGSLSLTNIRGFEDGGGLYTSGRCNIPSKS